MAELFQKNGRAYVAGVEVLRWRISLPMCGEKIFAFYEEIGTRAETEHQEGKSLASGHAASKWF